MDKPPTSTSDVIGFLLAVGGVIANSSPYLCGTLLLAAWCLFVVPRWRRSSILVRLALAASLILPIGATAILLGDAREKAIRAKDGSLIPAGNPMPLTHCGIPEGSFAVFLGLGDRASVGLVSRFPYVISTVGHEDALVIDRDEEGRLVLTAKVFDERGDLVAKIERNQFTATNAAADLKHPDGTMSSLAIYDHRDQKVLDLYQPNSESIVVRGVFKYGKLRPVIVSDKGIFVGGSWMTRVCNTTEQFGGAMIMVE